MAEYMSIPEAAVLWKTLPRLLHQECETHHIVGAVRFGYRWMIPISAKCPPDIMYVYYAPDRSDLKF